MKKNQRLIRNTLFILVSSISTVTLATEPFATPNIFSAGTPALAAEVNDNFKAIEDVAKVIVNVANNAATNISINTSKNTEQDSDIAGNILNIVENTGNISLLQRRVESISSSVYRSGFVSVAPHAFRPQNADANCLWRTNATSSMGYLAFGSVSNCSVVAGIQLPHDAEVTSLSCVFVDNANDNHATGTLASGNIANTTTDSQIIFMTASTQFSGDLSNNLTQVVYSPVSGTGEFSAPYVIDNENEFYHLSIDYLETLNSDITLRFRGCSVAFRYL